MAEVCTLRVFLLRIYPAHRFLKFVPLWLFVFVLVR